MQAIGNSSRTTPELADSKATVCEIVFRYEVRFGYGDISGALMKEFSKVQVLGNFDVFLLIDPHSCFLN